MQQPRTEELSASPPLFENGLMDFFSRVHPSIPAIIFVPVIVAALWLGADGGYGAGKLALLTVAGVGIWTLTEYWLHRLVFHWCPDNRFGRRLHFIIHGVHHDHPNDPMRLVMPPSVSVPLATLFLLSFWAVLDTPIAFAFGGGFLSGYLVYDMLHYHLHHHAPRTILGRWLRELHMRHHFQDDETGFGISAPVWDHVFRTVPDRRR